MFDVGDTLMEAEVSPTMILEPMDEPVPHWKTAPAPLEPPVAVKVVLPPLQIVVVPEMPVGAVGACCTVTSCAVPPVVVAEQGAEPTLRTQ